MKNLVIAFVFAGAVVAVQGLGRLRDADLTVPTNTVRLLQQQRWLTTQGLWLQHTSPNKEVQGSFKSRLMLFILLSSPTLISVHLTL